MPMIRSSLIVLSLLALAPPAFAQGIPAEVTLKLSREQVMSIGSGISELPYKTAAPLLQAIQAQIAEQAKPKLAPAPMLSGKPSPTLGKPSPPPTHKVAPK